MKPDDSHTRFELVSYFHGNILDVSEGRSKAFPHFVSHIDARITEPSKLTVFSGQSFDGVFSSYLLHLLPLDEVKAALVEWSRVTKTGGHLILHLPDIETKAQKWLPSYESVVESLSGLARGWDLVLFQKRPDDNGLLFVFKLTGKSGREFSWEKTIDRPKCGIVRLGAFGDLLIMSSVLPWLHERYHVTLYVSDHGYPVIAHDPHIDRFIIQGRDEIPPQILGEFWDYERKKYDKWVNLSESVESTLLAAPGHTNHGWPNAVRAKYMDVNYLEFTHEIAEVPPPYRPKFYSTLEERAWARGQVKNFGRRNILWSLSGSSVHKTWPWLDNIVARVMLQYPDTHIVMVGDELSQILETGWQKEKRVHCRSGKWSIRESMAFAEVADLIIGTETGLLNAAGSMTTPKIVTLSHSSEHMLCAHWINYTALSQPQGIGCSIQPCRLLHTDGWTHCYKHEETGTALCQAAIDTEQMWRAVTDVLGASHRMVA